MAEGDRDTRGAAKSAGRLTRPASAPVVVCEFVRDIAFHDLPADVVAQAQR